MSTITITNLINSINNQTIHSVYEIVYQIQTPQGIKIEKYIPTINSAYIVVQREHIFPVFQKPIVHSENSWSLHKLKMKNDNENEQINNVAKMRSILNKITDKTLEKFIVEAKTINYEDPEIVALIFNKIINDQKYTELYVNLCEKLYDMNIFSDICFEQFSDSENKLSLCSFISVLYNRGIINNIQKYIDLIFSEPCKEKEEEKENSVDNEMNDNIIILVTLISNIIKLNKKTSKEKDNEIFKNLIKELLANKNEYNSRCRCMILDLNDLIN